MSRVLRSNPRNDTFEMMAAQEDCRDYLRTGRCKYGASCKYNHPANVQSGGGIRDPNDPSEPQLPIRRGEPTCQYYLKHGTCKFGHACKFHHPPPSEMAAAVNMGGSSVIMNMGRNKGASQQIVLNTVDGSGTSAMALQFLPQRPDEPDCIYFLRNGRCKYGATCRYHHPVSFAQNNSVSASGTPARRQPQRPQEGSDMGSRVRSASSLQMAASEDLQGSSSRFSGPASLGSTPTHYVVTETPLAVVAGNANGRSNSYSRVTMSNSTSNGEDFMAPLNTSGGSGYPGPRDYNSSSSSIASSYETATSAVDYQGEQNGVIWSRPVRRIGSGGSLSAYDTTPPLRPQPSYSKVTGGLPPSVSDNSIASRRLRAESMGSTSDHSSGYPDAWNQNAQAPPTTGWVESSSSFEQARRANNAHLHRGGDRRMPHDAGGRMQHGSMHPGDTRRVRSEGETHDDGGLSMMTSALLNMLDTPEEVGTNRFSSIDAPSRMNPISPPTTPRSGHVSYRQDRPSAPLGDRYHGSPANGHEEYMHNRVLGGTDSQASRYDFTSREYTHAVVPEHLNVRAPASPYSPSVRPAAMGDPSRDPSKSSNVGLYLP